MVLRSAVMGNHDLWRYALSFCAHRTIKRFDTGRIPYGDATRLSQGCVSVYHYTYSCSLYREKTKS